MKKPAGSGSSGMLCVGRGDDPDKKEASAQLWRLE